MKKPQNLLPATQQPAIGSLNNFPVPKYPDFQCVFQRLMERDYAQHTRQAIVSDLKSFLAWYFQKNGEQFNFRRIVERDIADFRDDARRAGLAIATVNRRLVTLRLFFEIALEEGCMPRNPAKGVRQLAAQSLAPKGLTPQETRRLLREVEIRGNLRDRLILELLLATGLRCSELVGLTAADIELSERKGVITVRHAKGNKTRRIPLNLRVRTLLKQYLDENKPADRIFIGQRGELTPLAINKLLDVYGAKAGIENLHPHRLRHTFAFNYLQANPSDLVGLSQLMGHASIQTTAIYTQRRMEDLEERIEGMSY